MSTINSYQDPVTKLIHIEEQTSLDDKQWLDYINRFGLSKADLPELLRLIFDDDLVDDECDTEIAFYEVHVLRAVLQIDVEIGIKLYSEYLQKFPDNDYFHEEIRGIARNFGTSLIEPFTQVLTDPNYDERLRVTVANGLEEIGKTHPESREACVNSLISQLHNYHTQDDDYLNSTLVSNLIHLKAVEAVDLLEEVFANREIDEWVTGSWAAAQVALGLKQESDFSPEELKSKPPETILAIREMINNLSKLVALEDQKKRSPLPKKTAAKGFGSSKSKKNKR